ncbi:MAG: phytanoyl-CoA dioxygenase family protein [Lentisphaeria bacterium]|nr:phytanoyl-CoA dioxygenase family protein [Lentisphaeria bacterium]NQZ67502.1 phytanoyl-CoA dioxygenase family protein [Lentisphaeria bacterium]
MTLDDVIQFLGVDENTLTAEEKNGLDEDGFTILRNIISPETAREMGEISDRFLEKHKRLKKDGNMSMFNMVEFDPIFEQCVLNPRLLAAAIHVLGPEIIYSALNFKVIVPGGKKQALHIDWEKNITPGDWKVVNSVWFLDEFTKENGGTRLVPGSHKTGRHAGGLLDDTMADHPDQVQAVGPAGSVVVYNGHTWHSSMPNITDKPRRALHSIYYIAGEKQFSDQKELLSDETKARLTPQAKVLLDV